MHTSTLNWETPRSHRGHPRIYFTIKPQKSDSFYSLNQKKKPLNPGLAPGLKSGLTSCAQPALTLPQRRSVRVATAALLVAHDDFSPQVRVGPVDVLGCLGFGGARLDPPNGERLTLPRDEPLAVSRPEQGHVPARGSTERPGKQASNRGVRGQLSAGKRNRFWAATWEITQNRGEKRKQAHGQDAHIKWLKSLPASWRLVGLLRCTRTWRRTAVGRTKLGPFAGLGSLVFQLKTSVNLDRRVLLIPSCLCKSASMHVEVSLGLRSLLAPGQPLVLGLRAVACPRVQGVLDVEVDLRQPHGRRGAKDRPVHSLERRVPVEDLLEPFGFPVLGAFQRDAHLDAEVCDPPCLPSPDRPLECLVHFGQTFQLPLEGVEVVRHDVQLRSRCGFLKVHTRVVNLDLGHGLTGREVPCIGSEAPVRVAPEQRVH